MNPQQALQILAQVVALAPVPLATHQNAQAALQVLQKALAPKEAATPINKNK